MRDVAAVAARQWPGRCSRTACCHLAVAPPGPDPSRRPRRCDAAFYHRCHMRAICQKRRGSVGRRPRDNLPRVIKPRRGFGCPGPLEHHCLLFAQPAPAMRQSQSNPRTDRDEPGRIGTHRHSWRTERHRSRGTPGVAPARAVRLRGRAWLRTRHAASQRRRVLVDGRV